MEYTIKKLAHLAGISTRTLRYYDEIELLKPARINSSGYRIYGEFEVNRLQQILFYKELGVNLEDIKKILLSEDFNEVFALKSHLEKLYEKREQINLLIRNVEKTILSKEGKYIMMDNEKFEGFKDNLIKENELKYGKEIREKYGNESIDYSNKKLKNMSKKEYDELEKLSIQVNETIKEAFESKDPSGHLAQKACKLHQEWIKYYWSSYTKEAHMGVVQMYADDERFTSYYDNIAPGSAVFLRDAMKIYLGL